MSRRYTYDEKLMQAFREGSEKGFSVWFSEYYPALCFYAGRFVKDKDAVEDIVQDCFIKLWQRHGNFTSLLQVKAYLYKVVRFGCIDFLTRQAKETAISGEEAVEEPVLHHIIRTETWRHINSLVETLPFSVARVIKMLYIDGKSLRETATELNKSIHTIKSHRAKGIALLRNRSIGLLLYMLVAIIPGFALK